jgi:hypothetical protein
MQIAVYSFSESYQLLKWCSSTRRKWQNDDKRDIEQTSLNEVRFYETLDKSVNDGVNNVKDDYGNFLLQAKWSTTLPKSGNTTSVEHRVYTVLEGSCGNEPNCCSPFNKHLLRHCI